MNNQKEFTNLSIQLKTRFIMKTRYILAVFILINSVYSKAYGQSYELEKLWETDTVFLRPESIVYDKNHKVLYVSNFNSFPQNNDKRNDYISVIDLSGKIINQRWIEGLRAPTGITIHENQLYIVERDGISNFNIETGKLIAKYPIKIPGFLNDIAIDKMATIYFTNSSNNPKISSVGVIKDGKVDTVANHSIHRVNGIIFDNTKNLLIVGNSGDSCLKSIDPLNKNMKCFAQLETGLIDGLRPFDNDHLIVSHWEGRLFIVSYDGDITEILDTRDTNLNLADFEYIQELKMIIIPTLRSNKIIAYKIK